MATYNNIFLLTFPLQPLRTGTRLVFSDFFVIFFHTLQSMIRKSLTAFVTDKEFFEGRGSKAQKAILEIVVQN